MCLDLKSVVRKKTCTCWAFLGMVNFLSSSVVVVVVVVVGLLLCAQPQCAVLSPGRSVALAFTALLLHLSPHTAAAAAARPPTAARPENEPSRVQPVRAQPVRRCWKRATELRASQSCQGRVTGHHLAPRPDQTNPQPLPKKTTCTCLFFATDKLIKWSDKFAHHDVTFFLTRGPMLHVFIMCRLAHT